MWLTAVRVTASSQYVSRRQVTWTCAKMNVTQKLHKQTAKSKLAKHTLAKHKLDKRNLRRYMANIFGPNGNNEVRNGGHFTVRRAKLWPTGVLARSQPCANLVKHIVEAVDVTVRVVPVVNLRGVAVSANSSCVILLKFPKIKFLN